MPLDILKHSHLHHTTSKPLSPTGGFAGLKGNLAPDGAILKVTGKDILITIDLNDSKTFTVNIPKNSKCVLYRHKDLNILDAAVECSYY